MLEIRVFGDPAPQGSKNVYNGRVVESNAKRLISRAEKAQAAHAETEAATQGIETGPFAGLGSSRHNKVFAPDDE